MSSLHRSSPSVSEPSVGSSGSIDRRQVLKAGGLGLLTLAGQGLTATASRAAAGAAPPRIKLGQIGVGHAHASKLSAFRESDAYEVVGIVEPDVELRQRAQSQDPYRNLPWMTQEQLLNVPGLQAVLVETRVRDLLPTAEACIAAGKHIHLDKPAGESLPHFSRILKAAEQQQLHIQMGYMYRYNPGVVLLREFLKNGWLGEVFEVHTVMSKFVGAESRKELAEYPGGIMFEIGCHVTDLVIGVLGRPNRVTAYPQHVSKLNDGLQDNMLAVLEYPGATATIRSSAVEVDGGQRRHLVVCGSRGTFQIQPLDTPAVRATLDAPQGKYPKGYQDISLPEYVRYVDDAVDLARMIRGEKPNDFSYEHDLTVQTVLLQACGLSVD